MQVHKLKAKELLSLGDGMHGDGGGLYLQVKGDARSWLFRYKPRGAGLKVSKVMGLGPLDAADTSASLTAARELAADARRLLSAGLDPRAKRDAERARDAVEAAEHKRRSVLFLAYAKAYVSAHESTWKNDKHRQQWLNTLGLPGGGKRRMAYCDVLHTTPVADIDTAAVRRVLDPVWHKKPETASRIRGRLEAILDAAKVDGLRDGENPARWRGHLEQVYPAKRKVRKVRHQPAMPWQDIPAFVAELREREGIAERCVELVVLTAVRSQEARGALFTEINFEAAKWTIPAQRMKRDRDHVVPLSEPALHLLRLMRGTRIGPYVFPGGKRGQPISDTSLRDVLRDMGISGDDATVHGMRSSFRDWVAESTNTPNIVAEKALAHGISDGTEAAYRRGDLFEKRRTLMAEWGTYCEAKCGARIRAVAG